MTKACFVECVTSFKEDRLTQNEMKCIQSCSKRQTDAMASMGEIQGSL